MLLFKKKLISPTFKKQRKNHVKKTKGMLE